MPAAHDNRTPNRLQHEKSPYLLQHAGNPVDWYPWGDEAFARASKENRPVFLSIGYATCHWCHVMERESFEDDEVAALLNSDFVCIKVDREERPDIDQLYMDVCVRMNGNGGWPLNLILTPEMQPLFACTYLPKHNRGNHPGLLTLLPLIADKWREQPAELRAHAGQVVAALQAEAEQVARTGPLPEDLFTRATSDLVQKFDAVHAGFGEAPKFPSPHNLSYLLGRYRRSGDRQLLKIVELTLEAMRRGGLFDQIGFGFHRYATDRQWLVPHFEKMLYDQAGLAEAYLAAWQVTGRSLFANTAREIFTYLLREMRGPEGGFYSARDADSEGEEGRFYLWTVAEVKAVLGDEQGEQIARLFNFHDDGNYFDESSRQKTGGNIPYLQTDLDQAATALGLEPEALREQLLPALARLYAARNERPAPLTDDKILTAWNGMVISALATGARILDDPDLLAAANAAADFVLETMTSADGGLLRRYRDGDAAIDAFAEDYAFFTRGLLDLYRAGFDPQRLQQALHSAEELHSRFYDHSARLLYETGQTDSRLFVRPKQLYDGAHPATNSIALQLYARLALLTGDQRWQQRGDALLEGLAPYLQSYPSGFTAALQGAALLLEPGRQLVVAAERDGTEVAALLDLCNRIFAPETVTLLKLQTDDGAIESIAPYTRQMPADVSTPVIHLCESFSCQQPFSDARRLQALLGNAPE